MVRRPGASGVQSSDPAADQCQRGDMWRNNALYDIIGVLGWNDDPVQPGRGSAIFLHVARSDFAPTQGCVALELTGLIRVLAKGVTEILVTT
jgi:L,D-peptidoglycan transpeptidase YkuD (ErfK/YbiS/YcfS/YnhG family)